MLFVPCVARAYIGSYDEREYVDWSAATSGLYDNAATGITDGAYTSLSRALSDPTGADAAEWAAQKSDTSSQLKTGAIVAGAGVAGGAVGDVLINNVFDGVGKNNASDDNKK